MIAPSTLKRTCMGAIAALRLGMGRSTFVHPLAPRHQSSLMPPLNKGTRLFSASTFTPPVPPSSKGTPVYPDIDFSIAKNAESEAAKRNADPDAVFFVTGASRGIGLQFVKDLVERTQGTIIACCRSPDSATGLNEFIQSLESSGTSDRIQVVPLDLEDQTSIEEAGALVKERYGRIDALLNVAGLLGDGTNTSGPERSLAKLDRTWIEQTMAINVIGPVMLCKELAPLMKTKQRGKSQKPRPISVIANLSARVGSISDNELGGWYSYRFSKSALNQATRTMAHELKRQGTWSVSLHPGTTDTDLSRPFQRNVQEGRLFPVTFTSQQLLDVVDSMTETQTGGFYDWAGKALPF